MREQKEELNEDELDKIVGGVGNRNNDSNREKWAKVGIRIVEANGIAEYYLINDGTKISPKKAIEIYTANGGIL
ncbi:MAG: bacteriocin [Clostridia bacterium]|nr:bacteriocin [Clostridia bacterium]